MTSPVVVNLSTNAMKKAFVFLLLWSFAKAAADKEHVSAMVGGIGSLRCAVDRGKCGEVHSLKWYRGEQRIYVFSEAGGVARKEGDMSDRLEVVHESNSSAAELRISPVRAEDEGVFRCELTYVLVGEDCVTVQLLHFRTLMKPSSVRVGDGNGNAVQNGTTLGPFTEGADLRLECVVNGGRPTPRVVWTIRNKEIAGDITTTEIDSESGHVVSNAIKLVLTRAELSAQLQCEIISDALDESIKIQMDVDINVRPTKISLLGVEQHAVQGSKVNLECLVQGARPAANLTWYNGSHVIHEDMVSTNSNIQADGTYDTQSSLSFWATRFENGQTFRCEAENIVSRQESEKPLHATKLLEILYPPLVSVRPENITVNETADILLFCEYEANPASLTSVTWVQNGQDLNLATQPWKYEGGTTEQQALLIRNSSSTDLGTFECRLANAVGSSISPTNVYVDVHYKPQVRVRMEPVGPVIESDRQNVSLHCEVVSGNPPVLARARWFLDSDILKQLPDCDTSTPTTTKSPDDTTTDNDDMCEDIDPSRLLLQQASRGFHGNYSCEGGNSAGWGLVSKPTELLVYYDPGPATLTFTPTRVIKGQTVVLTCSVEDLGRPAATRYRWYRGSRVIPDVVTPMWTIEPVSLETSANFTCRAVNEAGLGESATVFVEVLAPPAFINNIPPYTGVLYNSKNINISCRIECSPPCSIQWLKDGRTISPSAPYYRIDTPISPDTKTNDFESVHSQLVWNMTQWPGGVLDRYRDNANYTCRSSENGVGAGVTSSTVFSVEFPPENITVTNKIISVIENMVPDKPVEVLCYAKSKPEPHYEWRRANSSAAKMLFSSLETIQQKKKDIVQSKLIFNKPVARSEGGEIVCEATNKHGSTSTTTRLNVMYKPECGITQTEIDGYQVLVCTANANPSDVAFTWRLKNENDSLGIEEIIRQKGLQSILRLNPGIQMFRTYLCVASNKVGSSVPCERDVAANLDKITGNLPWWRRWEQEPLILAGAAATLLLLMLLLCIPIICICRRRNSDKCGPGSGNSGASGVSDERDTYQNLSFHGLQHVQTSKNTNHQQQQYIQNSNYIQNNSIKNKGKKQFQLPAQDHHSFCYFQESQSENQCGNNVQTLPEHGSYDPSYYSKTLDRSRDKARQKSSRMKKSESLREKLSCVGSHSTDSFDRRTYRSNLNDFLASNNDAPSYFQHLLKNNTNPQRNYPPSYSYTMSALTQHRHSKDSGKSGKDMKNKEKKQLYGNFALTEHEDVDNSVSNNQRYTNDVVNCNNNQRKNNQPRLTNNEQGPLKYNEIDV